MINDMVPRMHTAAADFTTAAMSRRRYGMFGQLKRTMMNTTSPDGVAGVRAAVTPA